MLVALIVFIILVWAVASTAGAVGERVRNGDWWRLGVAIVALSVPVIYWALMQP